MYSSTNETEQMNMKASKANAIINNNLKSIFMQSLISKKGWTQLEARSYLVEFVTCGTSISLYDFMSAK
jgi:hypothetical protein